MMVILALSWGCAAPETPLSEARPQLRPLELRIRGWIVESLAEGVFALRQPDERRFADANSLLVFGEERALVVDAASNAEQVHALIEVLQTLESEGYPPLRYLVNTHWHADHTQGNALYRDAYGDQITIIGERSQIEDIPHRAGAGHREQVERLRNQIPLAEERLAEGLGLSGQALDEAQHEAQLASIERAKGWLRSQGEVRFVGPDLPFSGLMQLDLGQRAANLYSHRAHTRGDVVVHLPAEDVLATGDLIDALPFVGHGYPRDWIAAINSIQERLAPRILVPAHGPVFEGSKQLHLVRGYLQDLVGQVEVALKQTEAPTASELSLERWREAFGVDSMAERFFDQVVEEAVTRVVADLRGELEETAP